MSMPLTRRSTLGRIMGGIGFGMFSGVLTRADVARAAPLAVPVPSGVGSRPNLILFFPDDLPARAQFTPAQAPSWRRPTGTSICDVKKGRCFQRPFCQGVWRLSDYVGASLRQGPDI